MTVREITPGDPEFADIEARFRSFLTTVESDKSVREQLAEDSFRQFCASILARIAEAMGFALQNTLEIVRDMDWAFREGWNAGVERARARRLRP